MSNLEDMFAARWFCEHHSLCYATPTRDGLAVEHVHWHTCPHFDGQLLADVTYPQFSSAAAIDLRAGRSIDLDDRNLGDG